MATANANDKPAPFDFAAANAFKLQRAKELLEQEEARNPPSADEGAAAVASGKGYSLKPMAGNAPGSNQGLVLEAELYDGILAAFQSAGAHLLQPPKIEAQEGNLSYTVRARQGLDLYELKLSSQRHFVLVRAARSLGAFGKGGLAATGQTHAPIDVSMPLIGQVYTLMLDLNRYVVRLADDSVALVNETLLLGNLNENIFGKYGLEAHTTMPGPVDGRGRGGGLREVIQHWLGNPTNILFASVVVALAAFAIVRRPRK
jgi:hypothetical protein|eukprot:evm.model.NODE_885_length_4198_cov_16.601238.2